MQMSKKRKVTSINAWGCEKHQKKNFKNIDEYKGGGTINKMQFFFLISPHLKICQESNHP